MEALRIHDHAPNVPFVHKHGIQFLLSVLSIVDDLPMTKCDNRTGYLPLLLPLPLPVPWSCPKER